MTRVTRSIDRFAARTPTLPPATHTNSYALGGREVLLVEPATPYEDEQRAWIEWARGLSSEGRKAVAIVLTHHHIDHVSGVEVLSRELGLPVWAHAETAQRVSEARVERLLVDGESIVLAGPTDERWEILHTPGHAPGHICMYSADEGALVVGDMVASVGTILIAPGDGHMRTYLHQLARLRDLDASLVLPAHGDPVPLPRSLFERYIEHRGLREAWIVETLQRVGRGHLDALLPLVYADVSVEMHPIARLSLEAHLDKLVEEGRARTIDGAYVLT